jgi:hypothetical protein
MKVITVKATSNASGRPQRIAKGGGKQRTVSVDFSKSEDWNAGNAAGTLANALGWLPEHTIERGDKWGTFINVSL